MHDIPAIVSEGVFSLEDGLTIPKFLPTLKDSQQPLAESMFRYLLTNEISTQSQVSHLSHEWYVRSSVPQFVYDILGTCPTSLHSMTQYSMAVIALQHDSKFAKAVQGGNKQD